MDLHQFFSDKTIKPSIKTEILGKWIIDHTITINDILTFAETAKDPVKATCIEALEYATKLNPTLSNISVFQFISGNLKAKAPRIKWESAKVIVNIAHLYTDRWDEAINNLLDNTEHEGTVVRWSAATALSTIVKLRTALNEELLPAIEAICEREEKNSIRKIYLDAIKKAKKQIAHP